MTIPSATIFVFLLSVVLLPWSALPGVDVPPGAKVSADGHFAVYRSGGPTLLSEIDLVTGQIFPIPAGIRGVGSFAISPDGRFVAFTHQDLPGTILTEFDRVTGNNTELDFGGLLGHFTSILDQSPDGSMLYLEETYSDPIPPQRWVHVFGSGNRLMTIRVQPLVLSLGPNESRHIRASDLDAGSTTPETPAQPLSFSFYVHFTRNPGSVFKFDSFDFSLMDQPGSGVIDRVLLAAENDHFAGSVEIPISLTLDQPPVVRAHDLTVSTDPGSATATVLPSQVDAGTTDPEGEPLTLSLSPAGPYPLGTTTVLLTASDGHSTVSTTARITVVDTEPPRLTGRIGMPILFTPDLNLTDVDLRFDARDNVRVIDIHVQVTQNEPVAADAHDPAPDAALTTDAAGHIFALRLRAQRSASGHGRIYLVKVIAFDTSGNCAVKNLVAVVPASTDLASLFALLGKALAVQAAGTPLPYDSLAVPAPSAPG